MVSGQGGQRFVEKIRREAPKNFFEFAHPGFEFAHPGFIKMGGQRIFNTLCISTIR